MFFDNLGGDSRLAGDPALLSGNPAESYTPAVDPAVSNEAVNGKTPDPASLPTYILNTNTSKFHYPSCRSADDIKESNKQTYDGDRKGLIDRGYSPCGRCNP